MMLQFLPQSILTAAKVRSILKQRKPCYCTFVAEKNLPTALAFPFLHNSVHVLLQQMQSMVSTENPTWLPLKIVAGLPLTSTAGGSEVEHERADTSWMFKKCIDSQASVLPKAE